MSPYFVCKYCGRVLSQTQFEQHFLAAHEHGRPVFRGFEDGERKPFRVVVQ
jgi:hypothetical protein